MCVSGTVASSKLPLTTHGIPQGSILLPLLGTIYTNDLLSTPKISKLESYIDDPKVLIPFPLANLDTGLLIVHTERFAENCK